MDVVLLKPKMLVLECVVTGKFSSNSGLSCGLEVVCCSDVGVWAAKLIKLVDVEFPASAV